MEVLVSLPARIVLGGDRFNLGRKEKEGLSCPKIRGGICGGGGGAASRGGGKGPARSRKKRKGEGGGVSSTDRSKGRVLLFVEGRKLGGEKEEGFLLNGKGDAKGASDGRR